VIKMVTVNVKYLYVLPEVPKKKEMVIIEKDTIMDLINKLSKKYGSRFKNLFFRKGTGEMLPQIMISINGKSISDLEGFKTRLNDGDEILFWLPVMGG